MDSTAPPPVPPSLPETELRRLTKPWGFWATLGWGSLIGFASLMVQGVILLAYGSVTSVGKKIDPHELAGNGLVLALVTQASAPITLGLCVFFAWLRRGFALDEYFGLRLPPIRATAKWIGLLIVYVLASDGLTVLVGRSVVPEFIVEAMRTAVFPPLLLMALIVGAPVGEEMFFRGFLLKGWSESRIGSWPAIALTSLIWALIHQQYDLYQTAWIFTAGLLLGAARVFTGSLPLCVLLHALMNFGATIEAIIYMARRSP